MTAFAAGPDQRRNTAGRAPLSRTLAAHVRSKLGRDAPALLAWLRVLAAAGDPAAVAAAATLLTATIERSLTGLLLTTRPAVKDGYCRPVS